MKILYGIQGTGNGHLSRALEIIPVLKKFGEVDVLISGTESELVLPFDVKYRHIGLSFSFGKKGGIDLLETFSKNSLKRFLEEINKVPIHNYDVVFSDFEPLTAWACKKIGKKCIGLSNQVALLSPNVPMPKTDDLLGKFILRKYAPCDINIGFAYKEYDDNIKLPIIRKSIRDAHISLEDHYTVYLPAYSNGTILNFLKDAPSKWQVFSKGLTEPEYHEHVSFFPLNKERFEKSLTSSKGIIAAAGFGSTSEALFLGKKLMVVPQKNQFEQACNAAALAEMGVTVIKSLKRKYQPELKEWIEHKEAIHLKYPDQTELILQEAIAEYLHFEDPYIHYLTEGQYQLGVN